ncbi:MAG: J domain-containing protein [Desulfocapsa sp.]|nr:MAG: J domain-containing protein [Desulfocapsa sp.]
MEFKDYYTTLGIERDATQDEVKRAYRKLARKFHPDINKKADAEKRFKEVGEAYEVLQDTEKRAAYDKFGQNWQAGQNFDPPPDWDKGFEFTGGGYTENDPSQFSDFFESLFGAQAAGGTASGPFAGQQRQYSGRGQDLHAKISINLEDSYRGSKQSLTLQRPAVNESGHVITRPHTLEVNIPKGVIEGQRIRLAGQGAEGMGNGQSGDLFLEIIFNKHPYFTPDKRDIMLTLPITPWEAALGATIPVPTLGGKVELTIPPGSQTGRKLRLKDRGLSTAKQTGHQYVTLAVMVPEAETENERELFRTMEKQMSFNPRSNLGV